MYLDKQDCINRMNILGGQKIPFLFVISFDMNKNIVLSDTALNKNDRLLFKINDHTNAECVSSPDIEPLSFCPPDKKNTEMVF